MRLVIRLVTLVGVLCLAAASASAATTVDIVADSTDVQLEAGDGGSQVGKVTLSNISSAPVTIDATVAGDAGCSIKPNPSSISAGRRTQVTLTFGAGCEVEDGADVRLAFGGQVTPSMYVVKAAAAPESKVNWMILVYAFLIGVSAALAAVLFVVLRMIWHNVRDRPKRKLKWGTPLVNLGTDWSFKDSWVGNVTIGSAALVGLLAASDVLKAVLGAEPEAALGLLAVASALAAVFVAIGPLLVKVIGEDISVPTIGGTLLAALVTLTGTIGQITALTWQGAELTSGIVKAGVVALGGATAAVVWTYATRALWGYALSGSTPSKRQPSEVVSVAKVVAKAIEELSKREGGPERPRRTRAHAGRPAGEAVDEEIETATPLDESAVVAIWPTRRSAVL